MDRQAHHLPRSTPAPAAALLLALLLSLVPWHPALAQRDVLWRFSGDGTVETVREARSAGYAAVPLAALRHLGAEVVAVDDGVRLRLGEAEILLRIGSPFFIANGQVRQLVHPVYEQGGVTYVPLQLVVDDLPSLLGDALAIDLDARAVAHRSTPGPVGRAVAAAPAPAPATPTPASPTPASPAPASPAATTRAPATPAPAAPASPAPAASAPAASAPAASAPARAPARPAPGAARRLVVIDAGHGGVDPGARGPGGVREKDVALAVARRLAALLREDPTLEVRMTRERDTLIALTDRTRLANRWRQEGQEALFMSIHTNAHDQRTARGFETFFLSEARTEDARRVAQMENAAQRYENPGRQLDPLSFILHDLRQNLYLRESSDWAVMIQNRLAAVHPGPNRGVKQAGFVVLNGAFMPAVLVELGFITNPAEERMLADSAYQARLATQLAHAVRDFFARSSSSAAR